MFKLRPALIDAPVCALLLCTGAPSGLPRAGPRRDASRNQLCENCSRQLSKVKHHRSSGVGRACNPRCHGSARAIAAVATAPIAAALPLPVPRVKRPYDTLGPTGLFSHSCTANIASTDDPSYSRVVTAAWASQQQSIDGELAYPSDIERAKGVGGEERRLLSAWHASLPRLLSSGRTASPAERQPQSPRLFSAPLPSAPSSASFPPRHLLRDMLWGGECSRCFGGS